MWNLSSRMLLLTRINKEGVMRKVLFHYLLEFKAHGHFFIYNVIARNLNSAELLVRKAIRKQGLPSMFINDLRVIKEEKISA
jgi:hypothetical protein